METLAFIKALNFAKIWGSKFTSIFKFSSCKITTVKKIIAETEIIKTLAFLSFFVKYADGRLISKIYSKLD